MKMKDAQIYFKFRTHMTDVKFNYKNDKKNYENLWKCESCLSAIETQSHILWCPAFSDLRIGKDIDNNKHLVDYLNEIMKIRENLNHLK